MISNAKLRGRVTLVGLCSLLILALMPVSPSDATRSKWPDEKPTVTGPVEYFDRFCLKFYRAGSGQKACGFWYNWPLPSEINPIQDFGTIWIQNLVEPAPGMCVFEVRIRLSLPSDYAIPEGEYAPSERTATKKPRQMVTEFVTDAGGWTLLSTPATFKNKSEWTLFPDALEEPREREGPFGSRIFEWKWTGKQDGPMRFATGVTYNWNVATGLLIELVFGIPPVQFATPTSMALFQDCSLPPPEGSPFDGFEVSREAGDGSIEVNRLRLGPVTRSTPNVRYQLAR